MAHLITGGSLIQGSIPGRKTRLGNLEAVIARVRGDGFLDLQHYWRDQSRPDTTWQQGGIITRMATGPAALTQRHDVGPRKGNFEVVVPERGGLVHYWLDNSRSGVRPWNRVGILARGSTGPGAVIENRVNGKLEAVVLHGRSLVHYRFDRSGWRSGSVVTDAATGAPALIQSSYANHLEVVVPEGGDLVLYWLDGLGPTARWRYGGLITNVGDGPAGFVQGRYGKSPHRNFEVLVPRGDALCLYWRENTRRDRPWRSGGVATWGAGPVGAASLCSSRLGNGWLQALTQESTSIYHPYRYPLHGGFRWMRAGCVRLDDHTRADVDGQHARSVKLAQITGDRDAQHPDQLTLSTSKTTSGIRGTDLGVTVHHGNRTLLLFGDTHWLNATRATLDSIGEVFPGHADRPRVVLHGSPLQIVGGPVTDREYDVPLDAFSLAAQLFVFFTSDHFADQKVMGRSVLTRALDPSMPIGGNVRQRPLRFQLLTTFSDWRFINVSVQLRPAAEVPGYGREGHVLLVWGSGAYRADDLRLALVDLRDPATWSYLLDSTPFPISKIGVRYFAGLCGDAPVWSNHEEDARPVLWPAALGELSVRWIPEIGRYLLLAMAGPEDPIGAAVVVRTARRPWGPWSRRRQVFDWIVDGMGIRNRTTQFIHNKDASPPDTVGDCIFPEQCGKGGAAYAPYVSDVRVHGQQVSMTYTLSTWNPYQVMRMRHVVNLGELNQLEEM